MEISDTDLDVRDREWAEQVLGQDEELLLALKPIARLKVWQLAFSALFTVLPAAGFIGMLYEWHSRFIPFILVSFILFCSGVWNMAAILLARRALRRGIYLVTTQRLLYLAVSAWRGKKRVESYEIRPGAMICAEDVKPDGSGDLRIEYETEEETLEHGALIEEMPQAQRVVDALKAQVASLPPGPHRETAAADEEAHGKPQKNPVAKTALVVLGILALSFGGVGGHMVWNTADLFLNGEAAEGTVAGYERTRGRKGRTVTHAVIRYTAKDGRTFRERNPIGGNLITYDLGEKVTVYYDPGEPTRMQVRAPSTFLLPGVFALVGLGVIAVFFACLVRFIRDRRRQT